VEALNQAGVPAGPVYRVDEVFADPQVRHLDMAVPVDHSFLGRMDLVRNPVTTTRAVRTVRTASPEPGQHTSEVLEELGVTQDEMERLRSRGVI
jgi:formyl-CoA transferase